jgi:acyl-CoA-dependent ceramide synthase
MKSASTPHLPPDRVVKAEQARLAAAKQKETKVVKKSRKERWIIKLVRKVYPPLSAIFVLLTLLVFNFLPGGHPLNFAEDMLTLAYPVTKNDGTVLYGKGSKDINLIIFLVLCIFCGRYIVTEFIFRPLAKALGTKKKKVLSFMDMGWQLIWYTGSWVASGWFVYTQTNFDINNMFREQNGMSVETNPHLALSWDFKMYYMAEIAFWLSMILTTVLEKWRKDMVEMMIHHFMTSGMLYFSYKTNFAFVGTWILFEQDFADIFLPLAKMSKYSKMDGLADTFFAIFAVAWIPTRHGFFLYIYYHIWNSVESFPDEVALVDPSRGAYMDGPFIDKWLITLGLFQCLLIWWGVMVVQAVYKALVNSGVEDQRSDDDDSDSDADKPLWELLTEEKRSKSE